MNRSFDIFRMSANGADPDRGTGREDQMHARTNRPAGPPFDHGIHHHDYPPGPSQADYGRGYPGQMSPPMQGPQGHPGQQGHQAGGYGGFIDDRERDRERYRREPERQDYWRHEAEHERFQRGMQDMRGYPHDPYNQPYNRGANEMRAYVPPTTYGNVPYDQMRGREQHEVWRGRDENYDFWGRERHPHDEHPSLWQRVKGAFTGKGPKNYVRSDERIREDVCEHLSYHPYVDASDIEVIVRDGEVTLSGTVDARMAKRAAEECVDQVRGVKDIHNHLRIRPTPTP
jgi:hypothetical protein